ncbi:polysaccharide biosynthesis tyrosine autokinase [Spirosoma sp. HMF4905]|uniref:Polysaccharide biosynthesis tyrosine autokinase n=1 Tax=Spirosoma arboris TaxID=2682092 RepID=A0A7K1SJ09_9BACT|nr:tyrosine-protein kinase [Spirosoma arboris]MVM33708.1 polysaccharide biosynthesis tyrosine autokinase [Spirosoma arboris]
MSTSSNYSYVPYQVMDADSTFRTTLLRYVRHWYWFLIALGLMLMAAYFYLQFKQPIYLSQSSLLIKDEKKGLDSDNILKDLEIFAPKKIVENEIEVFKSHTLMNQVVKELGLDVTYFHNTQYGRREVFQQSPLRLIIEQPTSALYQDKPFTVEFINANTIKVADKLYLLNTSVQTPMGRLRFFPRQTVSASTEPLFIQVAPRSQTANAYLRVLKAEPTSKASTVIMLSIETGVPDKGEAILNRLIDLYTKASVLDKNRVASNTLNFIDDRLQLVSGELQTVEKGVENYKSSEGITDLGVQAKGFLESAQQNDTELSQVNIQLQALNDIQKYVYSQPEHRSGTPATLGLSDPTLLGLFEMFTKLEAQQDQLMRTTSEQNPLLQTVNSQLRTTKSNISENIESMREILSGTRQQFMANNRKIEGVIRTIPAKERILLNITRQQAIKNDLYTYLLRKREETAVSYASAISDSRVIDAALTDAKPIKPNQSLLYLLFGLAGLALPAIFLGVYDLVNNRVMHRSDVEEGTHVPILGEIVKKKQSEALVVANRSNSVIAEQIRMLRTNLNYLRSSQESSQVLLFTSSIEGEGKSFISLNLGASLALVGMRTVILEMDLRKPRLRQSLNMPDGPGLSDYLSGEIALAQIVTPIPDKTNYFIITSGALPPNPSEILTGARLQQLILDLKKHFDYVLIDAPPIGLVTDAQLIAKHADATLYIVRHDVTPKNCLKMLESLYREKRFNKLNVILNAVQNDASSYYSYGGYKSEAYQTKEVLKKKTFLSRFNLT